MSQNLMSVDRWSIILYKGSFKNYVSRQERVSDQSNVHAYKVQRVLYYKVNDCFHLLSLYTRGGGWSEKSKTTVYIFIE